MSRTTYLAGLGIFAFFIIAILGGVTALDHQYQQSLGEQTVDNERVIVNTSAPTPVEAAEYTNNFDMSVTVSIDGETLNGSGGDYTWYPATGELSWNASSTHVSDGDTAAVTYGYQGRPLSMMETREMRQALLQALPVLAFVGIGMAIVGIGYAAYRFSKSTGSNRRFR